eukprot:CAMPEP_0206393626 /NCGR_PEP_ID=MMETSP0294-20121207/20841_1 /ASSEMBLY_ACC=CAM_ASM_000327 /TAXON_ID=39354 /ORGANISM="Heterosigma akashiwo, Strain CCMP2393" /LENGTH=508 /DNA_ID=CAMNT_0053847281 /DNA_START=52 /DNA_END=1578 /DNA_ORIENTATION=-
MGDINIFDCAQKGDLIQVKSYVKNGGDIDVRDGLGWSPLHLACLSGNADLVRYLVEEVGADLQAKDNNGGLTPFERAFLEGKADVIKYIVESHVLVEKMPLTTKILEDVGEHNKQLGFEHCYFLKTSCFESAGAIPSFGQCRQEGWLQPGSELDHDSTILYVCCPWIWADSADPESYQYKVIIQYLKQAKIRFDFIWHNYSCLSGDRTDLSQWKNLPLVWAFSTNFLLVPPLKYFKDEKEKKGPKKPPAPSKDGGDQVDSNADKEEKEPEGIPTSDLRGAWGHAWVAAALGAAALSGRPIDIHYRHGDQVEAFSALGPGAVRAGAALGEGAWADGATLRALGDHGGAAAADLLGRLYDLWFGFDSPLEFMKQAVWLFHHLKANDIPMFQRLLAGRLGAADVRGQKELQFLARGLGRADPPHEAARAAGLLALHAAALTGQAAAIKPPSEEFPDPAIEEEAAYAEKMKKKEQEEEAKKKNAAEKQRAAAQEELIPAADYQSNRKCCIIC